MITHIGAVRKSNEDNYYVNGVFKSKNSIATEGYTDNAKRNAYLYAVCDGMGGESSGEIASMIAVKTLAKYNATDIRQTIMEYIDSTNNLICDEVVKSNGKRSGTTIALLYLRDNRAISYNIGDSRVYLLRKGDLYLMSEDHTQAQKMVQAGVISEEEAKSHNARNKLTQYLGAFPDEMIPEPYISEEVRLKRNDIFLVCSDGLTSMVNDDEIREILSEDKDSVGLVKELATTAQMHGGNDNITATVIKLL